MAFLVERNRVRQACDVMGILSDWEMILAP